MLAVMGLEFEVQPSDVDEFQIAGESPAQAAERLSELKAWAVTNHRHCIIIAADTLVVVDDLVLGKPDSAQQAIDMLNRLRAREHTVYTGLSVINTSVGAICRQVAATPVVMRDYSDREMQAYVATGDPMDKAGAYAIQNMKFNPVARILGCYTNVIGLPICHLYRALLQMGIETPRHPLSCCSRSVQSGCPWAQSILSASTEVAIVKDHVKIK